LGLIIMITLIITADGLIHEHQEPRADGAIGDQATTCETLTISTRIAAMSTPEEKCIGLAE
jgi:hypothetical protein